MSERIGHDLDAQLDRALRAIVARDEGQVDLHRRVMAAIGAPSDGAVRPPSRARASAPGLHPGPFARPAFGLLAIAALLVAVALAVWSGNRRDRAAQVARSGGVASTAHPQASGAPRVTAPKAFGEATDEARAAVGRDVLQPTAATRVVHRRSPHVAEPWALALPPLDPPEPIALEPLGEPPMRVARLEVERLSIDPLELDTLERPEEE